MKILELAVSLAKKAGEHSIKEIHKQHKIALKSKNNIVTEVDLYNEKLIAKGIKAVFPKHGFLGEEGSFLEKGKMNFKHFGEYEYIWIVDPIDGTTNYAYGLNEYAISIGVFQRKISSKSKNFEYLEGELIAGVVYAPELHELFVTEKGKGAYLNGKRLHVSKMTKAADAFYGNDFTEKTKKENLPYLVKMIGSGGTLRRFGVTALELCYVAAGRMDGYWACGIKPWDLAAGVLMVEEAGGRVSDINGNMLDLFAGNVLAGNPRIHKETVEIFRKIK